MAQDSTKRSSHPPSLSVRWSHMERAIHDRIIAWNERSSADAEQRVCRVCKMLSDMLRRIGIGRRP
jgi:hypothetical protein